ncbi:unnamed protein product, partial [Polarella glacialis]
ASVAEMNARSARSVRCGAGRTEGTSGAARTTAGGHRTSQGPRSWAVLPSEESVLILERGSLDGSLLEVQVLTIERSTGHAVQDSKPLAEARALVASASASVVACGLLG